MGTARCNSNTGREEGQMNKREDGECDYKILFLNVSEAGRQNVNIGGGGLWVRAVLCIKHILCRTFKNIVHTLHHMKREVGIFEYIICTK